MARKRGPLRHDAALRNVVGRDGDKNYPKVPVSETVSLLESLDLVGKMIFSMLLYLTTLAILYIVGVVVGIPITPLAS